MWRRMAGGTLVGRLRGGSEVGGKFLSTLRLDTISPNVKKLQYAVRGRLYAAAVERTQAGKPVIFVNIGNPHALLQPPITFFRQVLALTNYPVLMKDTSTRSQFPADAVARAEKYLEHFKGGTGAYQDSRGNEYVRREVASFLEERDGFPARVEDIFLTEGASAGVMHCLRTMIRGSVDAVLTPTPQYPLYSAAIDLQGGTNASYYLDEGRGWTLSEDELNRAANDARSRGADVRGLVVINPGNPTGQCLNEENMIAIARWCAREGVVLFADEVYQTNVYLSDLKFTSFRKVIQSDAEASKVECFSFHTISKGVVGECGQRGGYMHCLNINEEVMDEMYKLASISLCSNTNGQLLTGMMSRPPQVGDPSYALYAQETQGIHESLSRRASLLAEVLDGLEGISCNAVEGALYAFPQITLPPKAIQEAERRGLLPDVFYCLELLEETGLCTVPGSGFGQQPGTFHFRTTILPPEEEFVTVIDGFQRFHKKFMASYAAALPSATVS